MRKMLIASALLVLCSTVLGATVFREQVAEAAQAILPVRVVNTSAEPVSVTSSDDPGRRAFAFFKSDSWDSGSDSHSVVFTVPTGKRLVIEALSVSGSLETSGQKMVVAGVQASVNGQFEDYFMAPTFTGVNTSGRDVFIASQQTTVYADGGTDVRLFGTKDGFSGGGILNVSVQGHLIDCSAIACG